MLQGVRKPFTGVVAVFALGGLLAACGGGHAASSSALRPSTKAAHAPASAKTTSPPATEGPATFMGPDGVEARWVIEENNKPGTSAWRISGDGPATIHGFANFTAASEGQKVSLYVTTEAAHYHVSAYRIGYYGGTGGRLVWRSPEMKGVAQPACTIAAATRMVACDNWAPSITLTIGPQFVQGDYLFKLVADPGQQSYIPLTVWDPSSHATYIIQDSVLTWQGWNTWGGYDMYGGAPPGQTPTFADRAYVESFDRPYANGNGAGDFVALEYPLIYWAEEHGLNVTYWTDVTFAEHPNLLLNHKALITLGHDETWTMSERNGVIKARASGVNIVFLGATPVLRHARLQPSPLGPDREEVDYRDPQLDPIYATDPLAATGNTWAQPPDNADPSAIVGNTYLGYGLNDPMVVTDAGAWPWAGTGVTNGTELPGVLAGDYDGYDPSSEDPAGVEILAHSPVQAQQHVAGTSPYSDMTYYTWPHGGGVLSTGTIGWIPAMESCTGTLPKCPARVVQAATGNIFHLFGQGPASKTHPSVANWQKYY
ncbi:MAG: N,N-dimethylformamidase beta subunit family domain-containing protein [Acidimicrobiales bacterium]